VKFKVGDLVKTNETFRRKHPNASRVDKILIADEVKKMYTTEIMQNNAGFPKPGDKGIYPASTLEQVCDLVSKLEKILK
jgi:hypothetical protein